MITFKQYLIESRSAPLYHGTPLQYLVPILKHGILPNTKHRNIAGVGVSLTRNKKFAYNYPNEYKGYESEGEVAVIEIDQSRLIQRFKIRPFNYWDSRTRAQGPSPTNEFEEFVITDKPIPPNLFINVWIKKNIWQDDYSLSNYDRQDIVDLTKRHNIKIKWL